MRLSGVNISDPQQGVARGEVESILMMYNKGGTRLSGVNISDLQQGWQKAK